MNKTMIYGMLTALFALASCMGNQCCPKRFSIKTKKRSKAKVE